MFCLCSVFSNIFKFVKYSFMSNSRASSTPTESEIDNCNNFELIKIGSSLKFCYLAESKANIYPRLGPTSEWDIAAGHIILEEAGGSVKDFNKNILLYNTKESVINPNFIAKI